MEAKAKELAVEPRPCLLLHVSVIRGRNVTKGWGDYLDRPDPFVELLMRKSPDAKRRTATINNEANPEWNELFTYYLDPENENILNITLKDDNYTSDALMGKQKLNLTELPMGKWTKKTFTFNKVSEVDVEIKKEIDSVPTLRYSLELCDQEIHFVETRRKKVFESMKKLLGTKAPKSVKEVPTVAVIGSGGGFRAMVGFYGVFKALSEAGILDCVTYMGGLSGSTWLISTLTSHPKYPGISLKEFGEELKDNIDSSLAWLMTPTRVTGYLGKITHKWNNGQPISFTDFFGHLVGETLIKDRLDCKLTDQRAKLYTGESPMPLYTCVHVKGNVSAKKFQEWVEFTPFEIGMAKYGSYMKSEHFGSKFFLGKLARKFDEPPLHFLQGIWGSAFCIMFDRLFEDNKNMDPVGMVREEMEKKMKEEEALSDGSENEDEDDHDVTDTNGGKKDSPPAVPAKSRKFTNGDKKSENGGKSENGAKSEAEEEEGGYWSNMFQGMVESNQYKLLSSRTGRAGVVHNYLRGLALHDDSDEEDDIDAATGTGKNGKSKYHDKCDTYSTHVKRQFVVDGGLTFNSPYPLVVRRQRNVNVILSFDFSGRPTDATPPFKELLLAEKWCKKNGHPFPPIDVSQYQKDMREMYIFRHPTDPKCPIVLHFALANLDFKKFKEPGVPRETKEEKEFADFGVFDDPESPYSTFNFTYSSQAFDRLSQLMEFNTKKHIQDIKDVFAEVSQPKSK